MTLVLDSVSKSIHGNIVVDRINLKLASGYIYGLCGYNGCGKTMLMRLIAGLITPTEGIISYDNKVLGKDIDFPVDTGLLIENPSFLVGYSGLQNLQLLASIRQKADKAKINKVLQRVGLEDAKNKKFRKYSLGMKQRLGIAAAIMEEPALILLDEPTNALDKDGVNRVTRIIREEKERGALIIMTCHDQSLLEEVCDTIYKIEHGRLVDESGDKI